MHKENGDDGHEPEAHTDDDPDDASECQRSHLRGSVYYEGVPMSRRTLARGGLAFSVLVIGLMSALLVMRLWAQAQNAGAPVMSGTQQHFDNAGNPLAAGTISTYVSATSTSAVTYSDRALNVRNANPVVLDSAGRASIFLSATQVYRLVWANSANAEIITVDGVTGANYVAEQHALDISPCDGRMTLTSGVPVTTPNVTAATTVYFTPYGGNRCALYDGADWRFTTFSEVSLSLGSDAANTNYDLFAYLVGTTLTLERTTWTNDYDRTTNLTRQNGILTRSGAATRRYLGTYRTTGTAGQTEDSLIRRYVWNHQHKVKRPLQLFTEANTWNYSAPNWRQAGSIATHQVAGVVGWTESLASIRLLFVGGATVAGGGFGAEVYGGIGYRTTGVPSASGHFSRVTITTTNVDGAVFPGWAEWNAMPAIGANSWVWLEQTAGGAQRTTFYGDNNDPVNFQSGLIGWIEN